MITRNRKYRRSPCRVLSSKSCP